MRFTNTHDLDPKVYLKFTKKFRFNVHAYRDLKCKCDDLVSAWSSIVPLPLDVAGLS